MTKYLKVADSIYLFLLGIGIGGIIACGMFAAPVVFSMSSFLPNITTAESGLVMGKIFVRLNLYLQILLVITIIYELLSLFVNSRYCKLWLILALINVVCIALFVWYYTPFILDSKNLESENFTSMHEQSVWVFKILLLSLSVLFVWRSYHSHVEY